MGNKSSTSPATAGNCSASTIIAETANGSHVLKVDGYSGTKGLGVGKSIESSTFTVGGHSWHIRYFPDGYSQETADWICVDLKRDPTTSEKEEAKARFKLCLLDQPGEPVPSVTNTYNVRTFTNSSFAWGYTKFAKRKDLETSPHLVDDSFRIRCDITVAKEIRVADTTVEPLVVPPPDLHRHLGALLTSQVGSDVKLEVGGATFDAHRNVLAVRSPVFMAELFGAMREKTATHVRIDDMEPAVFKAFLHFIYTDSLPEIDKGDKIAMAQHLLVAADRYGMERLKLICEVMLHNNINTSTAANTLVLAERHGCNRLKEACLKFIASPYNLKVVMASDDFGHLSRSCPSLAKELAANLAA
ncbi:hypothetical protein ACP70R_007681 [Stipagrostis hirtigluma subsp. patula]